MPLDPNKDFGRSAVSLLATAVVTLLGTTFCAAIALLFAENPALPLLVCGGMAVGIMALSWLTSQNRGTPLKDVWSWLTHRGSGPETKRYHVIRKDRVKIPEQYGTNQPPTAERIRKLKQRYWLDAEDDDESADPQS